MAKIGASSSPSFSPEGRRIALLSNPKSTGNIAQLSRVREYCADHPDIFHYEVERADQIGAAMKSIAKVKPKVLVINGGDGTVQAALTEMHNGGHFGDCTPPVAVRTAALAALQRTSLRASSMNSRPSWVNRTQGTPAEFCPASFKSPASTSRRMW